MNRRNFVKSLLALSLAPTIGISAPEPKICFSGLSQEEKDRWAKALWKQAREQRFMKQFNGVVEATLTGQNWLDPEWRTDPVAPTMPPFFKELML